MATASSDATGWMSDQASHQASSGATYGLVRARARPVGAPVLDADQQAVVDHRGGPLLVLAGPGTGKTTTLVEAVAARIRGGLDPEQVLVLTFGRRAAAQLRGLVAGRIGRATKEPLARTFHSYAFGVLRREAALRGESAPRLLAGPEQDLVVRELLLGDLDAGAPGWPARMLPALRTRGFAQELRDLMMRAYERGLGPADLDRLGRAHRRDDWRAAARFMRQYAGVTALRDAATYDPAELIRAVVSLWLREPALLTRERTARSVVFVDELQDTDPAQVDLLRLLAGSGRELVAMGDPDQSVYGFRGADPGVMETFPEVFRTGAGEPARIVSLRTTRRSGSTLLAASRRVADRLGRASRHRDVHAAEGLPDGRVEVSVLRSESQEAAHVAARLREAHLVDGLGWSQMAVVVRSTARSLPLLRRALAAAGVPVAVGGDDVPLVEQSAVRPLLRLLECAVDPSHLDEETAVAMLGSPLGGADVIGLRRLRQELRRGELATGGRRASGPLLVEALATPLVMVPLDERACRPAVRVARLLEAAQAKVARSATAEDVLWAVWSASGLAHRWERQSREGGQPGAAADRDLDAVVALFDAAARFGDRLPAAGPGVFLDHLLGQEIAGDSLAARTPTDDAVQVLTAHASKGLEWDLVCVAGVQEGGWPDLRLRGSFLGSEQLVDALRPDFADLPRDVAAITTLHRLLDEERRLFYVAVTRARRQLFVSAVTSEREGLAPSRFLDELDPAGAEGDGRPVVAAARPLSLAGLVAELRQVVADADDPAGVRRPAAAELARLAAAGARGADPDAWWGLGGLSDDKPVGDLDEAVHVSPSKVESFTRCQLRWFLEHVGGTETSTAQQSVGTLVHAVAASALDDATSTEEMLLARLEALLPAAELGRGWAQDKELAKARAMVRRLARWLADHGREVLATELDFAAEVGRAVVAGRVDRIERDAEGRGVVIDLKTGSAKVPDDDLAGHAQLAAYQLAVEQGAFAEQGLTEPGGAELVQLGKGGYTDKPRVQRQRSLSTYDDPGWARQLVTDVAEGMAGSAFAAMDNKFCPHCPVRTSCPLRDEGRQVTG